MVAASAQGCRKVRDLIRPELTDVRHAVLSAPPGIAIEIASVGGEGVRRQAPLDRHVVEIGADSGIDAGQARTSSRGRTGRSKASPTAP